MWHLILLVYRGTSFVLHWGEGKELLNSPEIYASGRTRSNEIWIHALFQIHHLWKTNPSWVSVKPKRCLFSCCSNCLIQMSNLISLNCSHTIVMSFTEVLIMKFNVYCLFRRRKSMFRWVLLLSSVFQVVSLNFFFLVSGCYFKYAYYCSQIFSLVLLIWELEPKINDFISCQSDVQSDCSTQSC